MTTTTAVGTSGSAAPGTPEATHGPAPATPSVDTLLAWAAQHSDPAIQRAGTAARDALATLTSRHHADSRLAHLDARAAQLEAELAKVNGARAELRPARARRGTARDHDPARVRAWAAQAGLDVPDRGRIPASVLTAWRARTGPAA
ncbi:histone-like nucleoid-structuring protein Lsr2 [Streptomyces sp. NPDC006798]|uniref:Lsr2 family DNA-binding protein n=1 Tax=Streptomyces sp. NPDC006798 TaxID=3155462 RepID=UPI0033E9DDEE